MFHIVSSGEKKYINKYFIGYKNDEHKIKPLSIMLMYVYAKSYNKLSYEETKWVYFFY